MSDTENIQEKDDGVQIYVNPNEDNLDSCKEDVSHTTQVYERISSFNTLFPFE